MRFSHSAGFPRPRVVDAAPHTPLLLLLHAFHPICPPLTLLPPRPHQRLYHIPVVAQGLREGGGELVGHQLRHMVPVVAVKHL